MYAVCTFPVVNSLGDKLFSGGYTGERGTHWQRHWLFCFV